jgi:L-alanine-DL-glutamate epimerase-like enolase superfamily enzyme
MTAGARVVYGTVRWVDTWKIPRVKIKIGESSGSDERRDLDRIAFARKVIGRDTELYVDANGGYRRKQAIRVAHAMAEHDVTWFEEPVSSDDLAGLREVRDQVTPNVTAGEYGYDLTYFRRMLAAEAVDCLQVDVTRCGGITDFLRAAAVAAAHNVDVSGHCASNLRAPVAAAIPNLRHLESTTTTASSTCCSTAPCRPTAGRCARISTGRVWGSSSNTARPSSTG